MAQDAVQVDPRHYTVELENDRIRMVRIRYGPREKSVMHEHPPGLVVYLTDANLTFTYPDGRTEHQEAKAGQFFWVPEGSEHLPENLSDTGFEAIWVDLKS